MNKLISRNPIQRFKEGRKIVKADMGTYLGLPVDNLGYVNLNGNRVRIGRNFLDTKVGKGNASGKVYKGYDGNWYQNGKKMTNLVGSSNTSYREGLGAGVATLEKASGAISKKSTVASNKTAGTATPVAKPTPTSFMGQGIQQGWRGTVGKTPELTDQQKLQLINTGKFTNNDFATAGALQTALNNYFGGTVGSISVDNKWGEQSQKALNAALAATKNPGTYMNLSQSLDLPNLDGTKTRTNIHGRYNITGLLSNKMTNPENISTINLSNASPAITPQVSNVNLNRAQTRDLMRAHNLNPYNYSGAQRRALRNFYSTGNYDSNLLSGIISKDYKWLKKGGIISRNPVNQFKIRKGANGFKAAFDAARAKGLATFSYKGNDYNTRKSGETEEQWARNVLKGRGNTVAGSRAQGRVHYKGQDAVVNERTGQVTKVNGGGFKIIDSKGKLVKGGFRTQAEADAYRKKNHITGLIKNEQRQTSTAYSDQSAKASGPTKVVGRGSNQGRTTTRKTNNNGTSITVGKSDPKPSGAVAQRKTRTGDNIKANEATSFINAADFFDAISPTTAIANGIAAGVNNLAGAEYKPFVAQFGLNPFGYAKDITEGNLGNLALRGIDTYALAGSPGLAEGTDWLLTKTAPRLRPVTNARYIPKGGVENGTLNKWNWNSLARGGSQATQSSFNKGVKGVVEGGRRSMQRAANEGMLHGFNGADKAAQWGTNFGQNLNTGTAYFFRGAPTTYDVVADNAVRVAPWMVPAVDYSTQIIANQE